MNEYERRYVKLNKPGTEWQVLHDLAFTESRKAKQEERWWLPESGRCESWGVLVKRCKGKFQLDHCSVMRVYYAISTCCLLFVNLNNL